LGLNATIGELGAKLDAQTAGLDQANGRTSDLISIIGRCDARNAEAAAKLQPRRKVLGLF
jgi:hypothetical protein